MEQVVREFILCEAHFLMRYSTFFSMKKMENWIELIYFDKEDFGYLLGDKRETLIWCKKRQHQPSP